MYHHDRHRCLRHPGDGPAQLRVGARPGSASAAATERQRAVLPLRPARFLARGARHDAHPRQALSPDDAGQDRALPPLHEEPDPARELLSARSARTAPGRVRRLLQLAEVPRKSQQPNPGRCLLRSWSNHPDTEGKHQTENHRATTPAASPDCSFNFNSDGPDPLLNPLLTCPKGSDDVQRAAEQAKAGHGQIVAAMAEAGVGKSRLIFEFKAVSQSGWMVLEAFSVSHGKASAFLPVIDLLWSYFKISSEDDERTRREKINGKILTLGRSLEDALPYLYGLLGLSDENTQIAEVEAQTRKRRSLEAITVIAIGWLLSYGVRITSTGNLPDASGCTR